jgi:hypothetical protein
VEKGGELALAEPRISDDEDDGKPFGRAALREVKGISFSLNVRTWNTHSIMSLINIQYILSLNIYLLINNVSRQFELICNFQNIVTV